VLVASTNFLIPNWTFVAELLIFLIVLAVMSRVVLPPVARSVKERADGIRRSIQRAELLRSQSEEASAERRRILTEAREQARARVDEAIRAGEDERRDAQARAQAEQARLLEEARAVIGAEQDVARRDLRNNLGALIAAAAERVIGSEVDMTRHPHVLEDAMAAAERGA
jgi:F-type H+-transporting ATPase subunit b